MTELRVDIPEEYSVLYSSCVRDEGFVDVEQFINGLQNVEFSKSGKLGPRISGVLAKEDEESFHIVVNANEPEERQRFTAAHELGHYFMHRNVLHIGGEIKDRYILKAEGMSDEKEVEANEFAGAFLMPLDKVFEAMKLGKTSVESLASHFRVSVIAMANRLKIPT